MRIELHPEADAEFAAQIEYYEQKEVGLDARFYREVMASLEWIARNPFVPRLRKRYRRLNLKVFHFYIAYAIEGEVAHALGLGQRLLRVWRNATRSSICCRVRSAAKAGIFTPPLAIRRII